MSTFWDDVMLRDGEVFNPGWCGTCDLNQDFFLRNIVTSKMDELKDHSCIITNDTKTAFWWCGENICHPEKAIKRKCSVSNIIENEATALYYINCDPDDPFFEKDLEYLTFGHSCMQKVSESKFKWCGQNECEKRSHDD